MRDLFGEGASAHPVDGMIGRGTVSADSGRMKLAVALEGNPGKQLVFAAALVPEPDGTRLEGHFSQQASAWSAGLWVLGYSIFFLFVGILQISDHWVSGSVLLAIGMGAALFAISIFRRGPAGEERDRLLGFVQQHLEARAAPPSAP